MGDLLFHSPRTLGPKARAIGLSCNSCHSNGATNPQFLIGELKNRPGTFDPSGKHFRSAADNGVDDPLSIPSLRGARYTSPYGHDGRTSSLTEFIQNVVVQEFGGAALSQNRLAALTAYVLQFDFLSNPALNHRGRLLESSPASALRGQSVFTRPLSGFGYASCSACHKPESHFQDGSIHSRPVESRNFGTIGLNTPSLLNAQETAPYFHDGSQGTLEEVIKWYDTMYELNLSAEERTDLLVYLQYISQVYPDHDNRIFKRRLLEDFAIVALITEGEFKDDRETWLAVLEALTHSIAEYPMPRSKSVEIGRLSAYFHNVLQLCISGSDLAVFRSEVVTLRQQLPEFLGDWADAAVESGIDSNNK